MRPSRISLVVAGGVLLVGAGLWSLLAVPALVKFPLSTDAVLHYDGHFVTFVDQATGRTLPSASSAPLTVRRHIAAVPSASTSSVAVVDEQLALSFGGRSVSEHNRYALDRRTMENVSSDQAYTFAPANPGAVAGSYYITLPMNLGPDSSGLRIFKPETGTTYPLVPLADGHQPATLDGLPVQWFSGTLPMTPVASYERANLAAQGLPMTVPPARIEAGLAAAGISVPALTRVLAPVLTPAETTRVATVLASRVRLDYYAYGTGLVAAEPRSGQIIELKNVVDGIAFKPATGGISTLVSVLDRHRSLPGVPAALRALRALVSAPPQAVYQLTYTETPASVASMVVTANSQLTGIEVVTEVVPISAAVLGALLVILGLGLAAMDRRRLTAPGAPGEAGTAREAA